MCPELNNTLYETVSITYKPSDVTRTCMCVCLCTCVRVIYIVYACVCKCACMWPVYACACVCVVLCVHCVACVRACLCTRARVCVHVCGMHVCVSACVLVCVLGLMLTPHACEAHALPWALAQDLSPYQVDLSCRLSSLHKGPSAIPSQAFLCIVAWSFSQLRGICDQLSR